MQEHMKLTNGKEYLPEKKALPAIQGWNQKQLKTYLQTGALNEALCLRLKILLRANLLLAPTILMDRLMADILPSAWLQSG